MIKYKHINGYNSYNRGDRAKQNFHILIQYYGTSIFLQFISQTYTYIKTNQCGVKSVYCISICYITDSIPICKFTNLKRNTFRKSYIKMKKKNNNKLYLGVKKAMNAETQKRNRKKKKFFRKNTFSNVDSKYFTARYGRVEKLKTIISFY